MTETLKDMLSSEDEEMVKLGFKLCLELNIPTEDIKKHLHCNFTIIERENERYIIGGVGLWEQLDYDNYTNAYDLTNYKMIFLNL